MISRRTLEVGTAVITGMFGLAVALASIDNGIGWSSAGVDAGTFPFMTGLVIAGGSLFNLVRGALGVGATALVWSDVKKLAALFLPAVMFLAAVPLVGMHLAAAGYMFGTLAGQSRVPVARALVIALATAAALYGLFDWLFQVSLPRGALAAALGL
jgi:hypothetical protein